MLIMRKFLSIIIAVLATVPLVCSAQEAPHVSNEKYFSVRAAIDLTSTKNAGDVYGFGTGVAFGGVYHVPVGKIMYFQPGLYFNFDRIRFDGEAGTKYHHVNVDGNLNIVGMRMPLDFGIYCLRTKPVKISVYTGPELYFNFSTKLKYDEARTTTAPVKVDKRLDGPGLEIGWGLGIGFDICRNYHVGFKGAYGFSHMCFVELTESTIQRIQLSATIGYNFIAK